MLIVLIPCHGKWELPSLTFLDPYPLCLPNALYYKTHISICKPNPGDLMSCWLESNWGSFNLFPPCFQSIYDYLKILNGLNKPLAEPIFFSFVPFSPPHTFDCTHHPPCASLVILEPWFQYQRWGVGITAHWNGLVIAFLPAWWWRAWVIAPLKPLLGGWLAVESWSSALTLAHQTLRSLSETPLIAPSYIIVPHSAAVSDVVSCPLCVSECTTLYSTVPGAALNVVIIMHNWIVWILLLLSVCQHHHQLKRAQCNAFFLLRKLKKNCHRGIYNQLVGRHDRKLKQSE